MSDTITITIDDALTPGGAAIRVEPELGVLEAAAKLKVSGGVNGLNTAQVYALGVLNALKAFSKDPYSVKLPRFEQPKKSSLISIDKPVHTVTIKLNQRNDGGVNAVIEPKFSELLSMMAGRSTITEVHKYGLVACGRLYQMAQDVK